MTRKAADERARAAAPMSPLKKGVLALLALAFVLSIGARVFLTTRAEKAATASGTAGTAFLPDGSPAPDAEAAEDPGGIERALPYVTEASFFGMLGFALGYASRKLLKVGLIVIAVFFVGLQLLSYGGVISIDWSRAVDLLDRFVLNLKTDQPISQVLTDRLPSVGALTVAFFLGFRRG